MKMKRSINQHQKLSNKALLIKYAVIGGLISLLIFGGVFAYFYVGNNTDMYAEGEVVVKEVQLIGAAQVGGMLDESIFSLDRDKDGNVYTTGYYSSDNLLFGTIGVGKPDGMDFFVAKYDKTGKSIWVKTFGGKGEQIGRDVIVDNSGNVYVCGYFQDKLSLKSGKKKIKLKAEGDYDVFIMKLDEDGGVEWAERAGTKGADKAHSMALDFYGNPYVAGFYIGEDGSRDAFILKYSRYGWLVNYQLLVGAGKDEIRGISVNNSGEVIVGGFFSDDLEVESGEVIKSKDERDAFVAKYDYYLRLKWVKTFGGSGKDIIRDLEVNGAGEIYISGAFRSDIDFDGKVYNSQGKDNYFVAKLSHDGKGKWFKFGGGKINSIANALDADDAGDVYVTGKIGNGSILSNGDTVTTKGYVDMFVAKYSNSGEHLWTKINGGDTEYDIGYGVASDNKSSLYAAGQFRGTVDMGVVTLMENGGQNDAFLVDFNDPFQLYTEFRIKPEATVVAHNGDNLQFTLELDEGIPAQKYEWMKNGKTVKSGSKKLNTSVQNGDKIQMIKYTKSGEKIASNPIIINKYKDESEKGILDIQQIDNTLSVNYGETYQWFDEEGEIIEGAETPNFTPEKPGTYYVEVVDKNGFVIKEAYTFNDYTGDNLTTIYPNPVRDFTTFQCALGTEIKEVQVIDLSGASKFHEAGTGGNELRLDLSTLGKGVYIAKIATSAGIDEQKFIKQ